jgi:hypothetical protein
VILNRCYWCKKVSHGIEYENITENVIQSKSTIDRVFLHWQSQISWCAPSISIAPDCLISACESKCTKEYPKTSRDSKRNSSCIWLLSPTALVRNVMKNISHDLAEWLASIVFFITWSVEPELSIFPQLTSHPGMFLSPYTKKWLLNLVENNVSYKFHAFEATKLI